MTQPAKKRRTIRPYLRTFPGIFNLFYLSAGIGFILWAALELSFSRAPDELHAITVLIVFGLVVSGLGIWNFSKNRSIKP